jgi:nucleoside-diphosphate-sugar epimerase
VDIARLTRMVLAGSDDSDHVFFGATGGELRTASEVAEITAGLLPGVRVSVADLWGAEDIVEQTFRGRLSIESARAQLGYEPLYSDLGAGIRQYIDSLRGFVGAGNELDPMPSSSGQR